MMSRQVLVLCKRTAGVHVVPLMAGVESSSRTLRIRLSASCTASSVCVVRVEGGREKGEGGRGGGGVVRGGKRGEGGRGGGGGERRGWEW